MNTPEIDTEYLIRLKGKYQQKYGVPMDDWTSIMLYENTENFHHFKETLLQTTKHVDEKVKPIQFTDVAQAKAYATSKYRTVFIIVCLTVCFLASLIAYFIYESQEYKEIRRVVTQYKNISSYKLLAQEGKTIIIDDREYLTLTQESTKNGDVIIGKEYRYDKPNNRILVLLGRKIK